MQSSTETQSPAASDRLSNYSLWEALINRRSRRFSLGMQIPGGPLAYQSRYQPVRLSEEEEAALAFAACGITGYALADLSFAPGGGANIMAGLVGRTVASGDGIQTVALAVINDEATYLLKRPQDFAADQIQELIELGKNKAFTEFYRRTRVKIQTGRAAPPLEPVYNLNVNRWSAYAPGTTYFLPINDLTLMYINGLLDIFNETTGVFVLDERASFRPAGLAPFARSKGGHLDDDPRNGRVATIGLVERLVTEFVTIEQGGLLQNLGLASQALGLGGFPNFANHEFGWFQALGFRMGQMPASRYLGANRLTSLAMKLLNRDALVPYPLSLEHEGDVLLKPFCPPSYPSMAAAVRAVVERKLGPQGFLRSESTGAAWTNSGEVKRQIPAISEAAIAATIAYGEYVWKRYGRFPAYLPPYRTVVGFQACHLDVEFYDRFYRPEALTQTQRDDCASLQKAGALSQRVAASS
jgi:hypothetical protein